MNTPSKNSRSIIEKTNVLDWGQTDVIIHAMLRKHDYLNLIVKQEEEHHPSLASC